MPFNTKNYTEPGGEKTVIGGELEFKEGARVIGLPSSITPAAFQPDSEATNVATLRGEFNGYPGGALNSAFQVDLDTFIEESGVDYWVYGHTHYAGGSGTKMGNTTLLCNQLGYVFQNEHLDFDGKACIEV